MVTTHHGPVVVEFYDEACAQAKAISPWVTHLANKYFEVVEFYEMNVREESTRDIVARLNIAQNDAPTFLIYHGVGDRRACVNIGSNFARLEAVVEAMASLE
jgi:thiol-disulfide isomerase/thioredoxin